MFDKADGTIADEPLWKDPQEARKELKDGIGAFLGQVDRWLRSPLKETPPALGLKVSAGLGKTSSTLECLAENGAGLLKHGHIFFYVPTLELAEQAQRDFENLNSQLPSMVFRGRGAMNPETGATMCAKADLAAELAKYGRSVTQTLCREETPKGERKCAHFETDCVYMDQKKRRNSKLFSWPMPISRSMCRLKEKWHCAS